ncbi:MAG: glycosyltransferase [FCB group bacterium]|nr:glycosyltransferase [FCB group bacterium]MBL7028658.1 glycosyltransferase [Candidatus Neomarinimicrobiota bacterium]MBL7121768.1 glycosyltransferase [Candidatus Neomarinimicrobiota bacterium]
MILGLRKARPTPPSNKLPRVAVIVAARDEAHNLPDLLDDLLAQNYAGDHSFIIADDRSIDDTWSLIHKFSKAHPQFIAVRIVEASSEMTGKKNALTQCIKNTTASILIETDADCRMGPEWLSSIVSEFEEDTGIVVGFSSVRNRSVFAIYQALDFLGIMMTNAGMMQHGKAWSGSGQNLAFKRVHFTSIGGFTGDPNQSIGDDFYLVQKIGKLKGVKAKFSWNPNSFVTTAPADSFGAFYRQRKRWASDSRGLHRKDPLFFLFLASAFVLNTAILLQILSLQFSTLFFLIVGLKFCLEITILIIGLQKMNRLADIGVFLLWFMIQPLYIPVMGISGLIGKVPWK